ncbi:MAG: CfrBI family restriction endonuclease [Defluviitaleaceae bacterium]|nr:CfrBI family restriction endonuclease [Defluviitaleaceae bacterium]
MTLTNHVIKRIIIHIINSTDYRIEIINLLNAEFLQYAIDFFKKIVHAKLESKNITIDWYKKSFLCKNYSVDDIAINSGLNKKTISNMYHSVSKKIVLEAADEHFDALFENIKSLIEIDNDVDLTLTIKLKSVSVDLNVNESLIVINVLAVKRAALAGGLWSAAGKGVEKHLMLFLCKLYKVPETYYKATHFIKDNKKKVDRENDFVLINNNTEYLCEVKLMGKGNPESADAAIARNTNIFIADTLSQQNKDQFDQLNIQWVELRSKNGYKKFGKILNLLGIPHDDYNGNLENDLNMILDNLLK